MKTMSLSDAKSKLSGLVDQVSRRDEEIVITKNGRPVAVLVGADEYDSWQETHTVRSDDGLMREIKSGLRAFKARKAKLYTLDELLK